MIAQSNKPCRRLDPSHSLGQQIQVPQIRDNSQRKFSGFRHLRLKVPEKRYMPGKNARREAPLLESGIDDNRLPSGDRKGSAAIPCGGCCQHPGDCVQWMPIANAAAQRRAARLLFNGDDRKAGELARMQRRQSWLIPKARRRSTCQRTSRKAR
jgi:hypothetical protein